MESYEKYKPSGVEWIGQIPEHWDIRKIKFLTYNLDAKRIPLSADQRGLKRGDYPYYGATGIIDYIDEFIFEGKYVLVGEDGAPFFIKNRDVAFVAEGKFWVNNHAHILESNGKLLTELLAKQLNLVDYRAYISGSTRDKLTQSELNEIRLINVPKEEQSAIASFLDEKTAQIDTLIANKQKLIELLNEERTAIINQAVTKGINPEVKLKPSGIEWLGDIPEHWKVKRMKFYVGYVKGYAFKTELFQPNGMPVIKASDIKNLTIRKGKDFLRPDIVEQFEKVKLKMGDIIISTVGSTPDVVNSAVGQVARVPEEFNGAYLNQNTVKFYSVNDEAFANDMLFYNLIANPYRKYLDLYAHGTANQASLNIEDMLNFSVAIPDGNEQRKIIQYLKISITNINDTASKIEKEIELLQEYRTALISETVTGKIKVA